MYLLGFDIGTSSVKATLLQADNGALIASATCPKKEMAILSPQPGWAEQNPEDWWTNVKAASQELLSESSINPADIKGIGITYQMHGLVCVDKNQQVLRPSIIWCDSRAVEIGNKAFNDLGQEYCLENFLNSPGNFTASKLHWVKENEPDLFKKIHKIMLPGDYIAMKLTGQINTTHTGLSEGILWNFKENQVAINVLDYYGIPDTVLADRVEVFGDQGNLTSDAASELGLAAGTPVCYRSGDQPNNAFSLNVLEPGQAATTAGTSGVIYGIAKESCFDPQSRVNGFLHVNHTEEKNRIGVLLCINGTGILNSWLKHNLTGGKDYNEMNELANQIPAGSEGLTILPFGNGAERSLANNNIGACFQNLDFNRHTLAHCLRAAQEGIVFSLNYGLNIMHDMGLSINTVRAGDANMFQSPIFAQTFATVTNCTVELYNTDGSQGAARGAGVGCGVYKDFDQAFIGFNKTKSIEPDPNQLESLQNAYANWLHCLEKQLSS